LLTDGADILPREDRDAAAIVRAQIEKDGVTIFTGAQIHSASRRDGAKSLLLNIGDRPMELACDAILVAVGRVPNLEGLGLDAAAVRYGMRGVDVDARMRTSNPRVYAAGDVCSRYQFTHAADAMARIVIANALFLARRKASYLVMPCAPTDPEIAHVGYYERDAQAAGYNVATLTQPLSEVDRAIPRWRAGWFARFTTTKIR
jgi:pyruvate/2-oxoglutarate dehydrogenase complex dihydrolipoamide dehydrogenase (E3) component